MKYVVATLVILSLLMIVNLYYAINKTLSIIGGT